MEKKDASFNTMFADSSDHSNCFPVFVINFKGAFLCPDWSSNYRLVLSRSNRAARVEAGRRGRRHCGVSFGARSSSFFLNQNKEQSLAKLC
jgi:hypothetical protein